MKVFCHYNFSSQAVINFILLGLKKEMNSCEGEVGKEE
jgi:hypothetical protein